MTIKFSTKVLLRFLNKIYNKFSTISDAEGGKGFSDTSVESLRFRYTFGLNSWGTLKDSCSKNQEKKNKKYF